MSFNGLSSQIASASSRSDMENSLLGSALGAGIAYSWFGGGLIALGAGAAAGYFAYTPVKHTISNAVMGFVGGPANGNLVAPALGGAAIGYGMYFGDLSMTAAGAAAGAGAAYVLAKY